MSLDNIDLKILEILQEDGRITNNDLAKKIGLTTTPTLERVKRLTKDGIIEGYQARINREKVDKGFTAFVSVTLAAHKLNLMEEFNEAVRAIPEILACYNTTGEGDFLLHVIAKDTKDYEKLMRTKLTILPDIQRIRTNIVLNTIKEQTKIPVK